jgi:hypothetical protein
VLGEGTPNASEFSGVVWLDILHRKSFRKNEIYRQKGVLFSNKRCSLASTYSGISSRFDILPKHL